MSPARTVTLTTTGQHCIICNDIINNTRQREEMTQEELQQQKGIFFSQTMYRDYKECTSPERHVRWPKEGTVQSHISTNNTCGMKSNTSPLS